MTTKTILVLVFLGEDGRKLKIILDDPKDGIEKAELTELETAIVDSNIFETSQGEKITKLEQAFILVKKETDLLQG